MNHMTRGKRCLVVLAGVVLWTVALSCALQAAEKVRLATDWYPQPEHGGFYHALVKGYYRDAGLDVEILAGGPNAFAVQKVATKAADFGMGSTDDVLVANERGIPVMAVGATMQHDPQGIMVHEDSPVRSFEDLEGRVVAVAPGTVWFPYLVKRYQLKKVQERAHNFSVGSFVKDPAYIQQCFLTSEPFFARQAGAKPRVLLISDSGYDPYRVFFTRRAMVGEKPEVVKAFVVASLRGWREYLEDPTLAHAEIKKRNPDLTPEKMDYSHRALKEHRFIGGNPEKGDVQGAFRGERWQRQFDTMKELGVIRGRFELSDAWTGQFCNQAKVAGGAP
jgi:NitT/TauT family transport system substrate-binding protein